MLKFLKSFIPLVVDNFIGHLKASRVWHWLLILVIFAFVISVVIVWGKSTIWVFEEFAARNENIWYGVGCAVGYNLLLAFIFWLTNILYNAVRSAWYDYQREKKEELYK